jgi:hypothetical protein
LDAAEKQTTTPTANLDATLPSTDNSVQAYLFLLGAFAIEAIMWGTYVYYSDFAWKTCLCSYCLPQCFPKISTHQQNPLQFA